MGCVARRRREGGPGLASTDRQRSQVPHRGASEGLEVLGRDVVEELAELLDLVLLLGGYGEAGLVEDLLGAEDARAGPQRERDRVGGAGADLGA